MLFELFSLGVVVTQHIYDMGSEEAIWNRNKTDICEVNFGESQFHEFLGPWKLPSLTSYFSTTPLTKIIPPFHDQLQR